MASSKILIVGVIGLAALVLQPINGASVSSDGACICSRQFLPICGSDGQTYSNECLFQCEQKRNPNLHIKSNGKCDEPSTDDLCICTLDYRPVCGSDSKTYPNRCSLTCAQRKRQDLIVKHDGECIAPVEYRKYELDSVKEQCICPYNFEPLCASDGTTYSNECQFNCEKKFNPKLEVIFFGNCPDAVQTLPADDLPCVCSLLFQPVCGSDGQTYSNECALNCAKKRNTNLAVDHQGECNQVSNLPVDGLETTLLPERCICPALLAPVCGSDGKNYANSCLLNCEQRTKKDLTIKHYGNCN